MGAAKFKIILDSIFPATVKILLLPPFLVVSAILVVHQVNGDPTQAELMGQQYFDESCNFWETKSGAGVPLMKCNEAYNLTCIRDSAKCGCDRLAYKLPRGGGLKKMTRSEWNPGYKWAGSKFEKAGFVKRDGKCVYDEFAPCLDDGDCIKELECQDCYPFETKVCAKPGTKLYAEYCYFQPQEGYCMLNRDLWCSYDPGEGTQEGRTGNYCRCKAGKWNPDAVVINSKYHPSPGISPVKGKCQIPLGEKCGKEAKNLGRMDATKVQCWDGSECKAAAGNICVKKPEPKTTPRPPPKTTKKITPKPKHKFVDTPCKKDCDHVNGDLRFLFCHHDKCECLPSPKKGAQVPTGWDPLMEVPGLNETGQCVIKDTHDCKNHFLPYSCRTKFICGEKGKCIPEPTFIDEPCKDTCDHVQGDERFLACHSGKCHCLPSTKFLDKDKKKIKQVLTEWDAKKVVQNMTYKGQCVIQEDQDCEGPIMPIECKTGFHCNKKGRCAKEPTFVNEPCKDSCDHVEGDERFLTCHAGKCVCLPSTKFADKSKKKLVQVPTEWDPHKKVVGSKTKLKGQCVIKNGKDCMDHLMSYECRTGHICGDKGICIKKV